MDSIRIVPDAPTTPAPPAIVPEIVETPTGVAVRQPGAAEQTDPNATPDRPAWLPEKFKSAEDLASAYSELEKKLGAPKAPAVTTTPAVTQEAAKSGLDLGAMAAEFAKDGKLGADSVAKLTAAGISESDVQRYVAGQQAVASQMKSEVAAVAGGEDGLKSVLEWANANADAATVKAYNDAIDSGNVGLVKLATAALVAKHTDAVGSDGKRIVGEAASAADGDAAFGSNAEMVAAMSDPKYAKDQAYRNKVRARLAKTQMFGV